MPVRTEELFRGIPRDERGSAMTSIRLPISFSLALGATATLFWFLGALTAVAPSPGPLIPTVPEIRITHVPEELPSAPPPPVKPPKPEPIPTDPILIEPTAIKDPGPHMDVNPLLPGNPWTQREGGRPHDGPKEITGLGGTDHGPVPSVRIEPDYPPGAKDRGIEGWVTFRFTVARDGSVNDVEIVDAQPPHVWDSATKRAVSSWKYQPAVKDGAPVEQAGMMATYRFELER
jgi:protein TonB